jgi:hypothetical protein
MAIVVALADRRPQQVRRSEKEPVEAQILLFTGVRYERLVDEPKRRPAQRVSRVKNK